MNLDEMVLAERLREIAQGTGTEARRARLGPRPSKPTHCPQDHEYNETNTLWTANGRRMCLACIAARRMYTKPPPGRYAEHVIINEPYETRKKSGC